MSRLTLLALAAPLWAGAAQAADTYIYYNPSYIIAADVNDLKNALVGVGASVTTSTSSSWPTSWSGYQLVIILLPASHFSATQVSALETMVDGGGRLVVSGDWGGPSQWGNANSYASSLVSDLGTGLSMTGATITSGCSNTSSITSDQVTDLVSTIQLAASNQISGGTALVRSGGSAVLSVDQPASAASARTPYDVILSGDVNLFIDSCGSATTAGYNITMWENLYLGLCPDDDGDGYEADSCGGDDCDDTDPSVHPYAAESVADSVDQDCDNVDTCYNDSDGDNYGTALIVDGSSLNCVTGTGASNDDDCNDGNASVNPGASETVADGIDQDCDSVDSCYTDADGDEYGTSAVIDGSSLNCLTGTGANNDDDCDDADASVNPAASEVVADGIDQNCDRVDSCYTDADGDDYGTIVVIEGSSLSCATGLGASNDDDCNDSDANVNPAEAETVADGIDQDCDSVDSCYTDADGDEYGTSVVINGSSLNCLTGTGATNDDDCDDANATVNPAAAEVVADSIDQDCDRADSCYTDADGDDYGTIVVIDGSSLSCATGLGASNDDDCDDTNDDLNPGEAEIVADSADQDCDGVDSCYTDNDDDEYGTTVVIDGSSLSCLTGTGSDNDDDCDDTDADVSPAETEVAYDGLDNDCDGSDLTDLDGDGYDSTLVSGGSDCDDGDSDVHPSGTETADGVDDDCDGTVDEGTDWYDDDGDGWTEAGGDCDDSSATTHSGVTETCDGEDDDCDGIIDEGTDCFDDDGDGYSEADGDCNDGDGDVDPSVTEVDGNGIDDDCDGIVDDGTFDDDSDGYTSWAGDCNDLDASVYPGAPETPDGLDNDCDGEVDEDTSTHDDDGDGYSESGGDCDDADADVSPATEEGPTDETGSNGVDDDCDGLTDEGGTGTDDDGDGLSEDAGDCDDANTDVSPSSDEDTSNGVDDDCDGETDEGADDLDGDGYTTEAGDCDDFNGWVGPSTVEMCDGIDNNCDSRVDEDCEEIAGDTGTGEKKPACGCASGRGSAGLWLGLLAAVLARRRRTRCR